MGPLIESYNVIYLIIDNNEILMSSYNIETLLKMMVDYRELAGKDITKLIIGVGTDLLKVKVNKCEIWEDNKVLMRDSSLESAVLWCKTSCKLKYNLPREQLNKSYEIGPYKIVPTHYSIDNNF